MGGKRGSDVPGGPNRMRAAALRLVRGVASARDLRLLEVKGDRPCCKSCGLRLNERESELCDFCALTW